MFNSRNSSLVIILLSVALVALFSCSQNAEDGHAEHADHTDHTQAAMAAHDEDGGEMAVWNKVCPIRGKEVSTEAQAVEYNGKTYGFCCPGCDEKFNVDPAKYVKNLSEDGSKFIGG